jgi:hypothetical protein
LTADPETSESVVGCSSDLLSELKNLDFSGKPGENDCNLSDVGGAVEERNMAAERPVAKLELFCGSGNLNAGNESFLRSAKLKC